jgi:hypothetical protein
MSVFPSRPASQVIITFQRQRTLTWHAVGALPALWHTPKCNLPASWLSPNARTYRASLTSRFRTPLPSLMVYVRKVPLACNASKLRYLRRWPGTCEGLGFLETGRSRDLMTAGASRPVCNEVLDRIVVDQDRIRLATLTPTALPFRSGESRKSATKNAKVVPTASIQSGTVPSSAWADGIRWSSQGRDQRGR